MALLPFYEFHVSANARKKYDIKDSLFATNGQLVFADFLAARELADQMYKNGINASAAE